MKLSDLGQYDVVNPSHAFSIDQRNVPLSSFDNAQGALSQSQSILDKGDIFKQTTLGAGKQLAKDVSLAGAQNAGPVGQDMLNHAPAFKQSVESFNTAMAPTNDRQQQGATLASITELGIPSGAVTAEAKAGGALEKPLSALTNFLKQRATSKATKAVQSTVETMTKGEREAAILEGRLEPSFAKGGNYLPSETEKRAGQILTEKVGSNPIKNVPIIQEQIAQRGKEAEQFLGMNGRHISNEEDFQMFQDMKTKAEKYLTPEQMKNYDHTINQFQGELKGMGNMNTGTYYKALKNFEQNVTARLRQGNEALLTDSGSAQLQAAKDVRMAVRNMIGTKNPEFKEKMFDLASLYDALDNTVTKAGKVDTFSKRFPVASKAIKYGLEAIGAGGLYEGAKKAGVPLPL